MNVLHAQFTSVLPTQIRFGAGIAFMQLAEEIKQAGAVNVLLVTDRGLMQTDIIGRIKTHLVEHGLKPVIYGEVEPNPTADNVRKGKEMFASHACELIVAVGGGSAMDAAKSIAAASGNAHDIMEYRRGGLPVEGPLPPLFMIPTTAGTGSEVTAVSVISDPAKNRKFVVASPYIAPKLALIDPEVTYTLPRQHIAATGMDALVHGIEAYTSNKANPISDGLALQAIRMIREYLPASYTDPTNLEAKAQMILASAIAGLAFSISGTALVHSLSHPMTAWYHVPHGLANAIILPYILEYNLPSSVDKYAEVAGIFDEEARTVSKWQAAERLAGDVRRFSRQLDIPANFGYLNTVVDDRVLDQLSDDAMDDRGTIPNNPRKPVKDDVIKLYKRLFPQYKEVGMDE